MKYIFSGLLVFTCFTSQAMRIKQDRDNSVPIVIPVDEDSRLLYSEYSSMDGVCRRLGYERYYPKGGVFFDRPISGFRYESLIINEGGDADAMAIDRVITRIYCQNRTVHLPQKNRVFIPLFLTDPETGLKFGVGKKSFMEMEELGEKICALLGYESYLQNSLLADYSYKAEAISLDDVPKKLRYLPPVSRLICVNIK